MSDTPETAIACTLQPGDFKTRLASIAALNNTPLLDDQRDDLRLRLTYSIEARDQVLATVEAERACCAFLNFTVIEAPETIQVVVVAPEAAREAAEAVFEPFRSRSGLGDPQDQTCTCCPTSTEPQAGTLMPTHDKITGRVIGTTATLAAAMAWFAGKLAVITVLATAAVVAAWGWVVFQTYRSRRKPATSTVLVLAFATIMLVGAFQWPQLEPLIFRLIGK